jgi:hypothetical protein
MARTAVTARLADVAQPEKWAFQVLAVPWVRSAPPVKTVVCMARRALLALQDTIDAFQIKYMFLYGDSVDETRALVLVPPLLVPSITPPPPPPPPTTSVCFQKIALDSMSYTAFPGRLCEHPATRATSDPP